MYTVHVHFHVKEQNISQFKAATIENARNSIKEEGIARFDVLQHEDNPARFILVEAYRSEKDQQKHRETEHYKKWRATVLDLLVEPYTFVKFNHVYTQD